MGRTPIDLVLDLGAKRRQVSKRPRFALGPASPTAMTSNPAAALGVEPLTAAATPQPVIVGGTALTAVLPVAGAWLLDAMGVRCGGASA